MHLYRPEWNILTCSKNMNCMYPNQYGKCARYFSGYVDFPHAHIPSWFYGYTMFTHVYRNKNELHILVNQHSPIPNRHDFFFTENDYAHQARSSRYIRRNTTCARAAIIKRGARARFVEIWITDSASWHRKRPFFARALSLLYKTRVVLLRGI